MSQFNLTDDTIGKFFKRHFDNLAVDERMERKSMEYVHVKEKVPFAPPHDDQMIFRILHIVENPGRSWLLDTYGVESHSGGWQEITREEFIAVMDRYVNAYRQQVEL